MTTQTILNSTQLIQKGKDYTLQLLINLYSKGDQPSSMNPWTTSNWTSTWIFQTSVTYNYKWQSDHQTTSENDILDNLKDRSRCQQNECTYKMSSEKSNWKKTNIHQSSKITRKYSMKCCLGRQQS